jgi:hypothetical protein
LTDDDDFRDPQFTVPVELDLEKTEGCVPLSASFQHQALSLAILNPPELNEVAFVEFLRIDVLHEEKESSGRRRCRAV